MAAPTCDELRLRLAEAQAALHRLAIGGRVSSVKDGDRQVDFSTSGDELRRAIESYERQIAACDGVRSNNRRAFRVTPV